VTTAGRASTGVALLAGLVLLAGCGGEAPDDGGSAGSGPPTTSVQAGGQEISLDPTQYCLDGDGQRYQTSPPVLEVAPDTTIVLAVPDRVAAAGWSVQVFDEKLEEQLGEVDVPEGQTTFAEITTSDVVPPTFYLVLVEDSDPEACSGLSGAWPVGFIRAGTGAAPTSPSETPAG
jgi:hypothetical protein